MKTNQLSHAPPRLAPEFMPPVASYADVIQQQIARSKVTDPSVFKVRAQLLSQGRSETVLAASPQLTLRLKVYASGGENTLHAHANEDHLFILLQGSADFYDAQGLLASVGALEGVLLPKGAHYRFIATSAQPLVMLRVGSPNEAALGLEGRVNSLGQPADPLAVENKTESPRFISDAFFG